MTASSHLRVHDPDSPESLFLRAQGEPARAQQALGLIKSLILWHDLAGNPAGQVWQRARQFVEEQEKGT